MKDKTEYHLFLQSTQPGAPEEHMIGTMEDVNLARGAGYLVEIGAETTPENTREPVTYGGDVPE
jgi:formyltetrahydrofolate synthetase